MVNYQFTKHPGIRITAGNLGRNRFRQNEHTVRRCRAGWKPLPVQVGDYPGGYTTVRCYPQTGELTQRFHDEPNSQPWFKEVPTQNQRFARSLDAEALTAANTLQQIRNPPAIPQPYRRFSTGMLASQMVFPPAQQAQLGLMNPMPPAAVNINEGILAGNVVQHEPAEAFVEHLHHLQQMLGAEPEEHAMDEMIDNMYNDAAQPGAEDFNVGGQGDIEQDMPDNIDIDENFEMPHQEPFNPIANEIDGIGQAPLAPVLPIAAPVAPVAPAAQQQRKKSKPRAGLGTRQSGRLAAKAKQTALRTRARK